MSTGPEVKFEIGHVLFLDVVGYSKRLTNEQNALIDQLNQIVRSSDEFKRAEAADRLIKIPTGDGMALVFYKSPEQPVECAVEIGRALKTHPELHVRMGVHSGPVSAVTDLNERTNAAGIGINIAQRVMDCGDAGHILLSKRVAEDLEQYGQWQSALHDLGEVEVKHGVQVHVVNLYTDELGNPEVPEKFRRAKAEEQIASGTAASDAAVRHDEGFWVAVLPFKYSGSNSDLTALAEGLTEEIVTGLSRFSYLKVISRSSTSRYANDSIDVRSAGKQLGARYVMEGSLRQAGTRLRIAVQLVDATTGAHLWAENYERAFTPEAVFELQDDLVPRIVSTVADMNGVLPRSMSQAVRGKTPEELSPYEAVLRSFAYFEIYTPEELSAARSGLETAVRKAPIYADAWAMLSYLCAQDYIHEYELQANALEIAVSAARRAVELGPSNHLAYFSLAQSLWSQKDFDSLRDAAERSIALNPMDGNSVALLGEYLTYAGSAERGMQLAERAKQLNPNHPGSYWYADFYHAFSQGDYRAALAFALKVKLRGNPLAPMMIAAACGQLGDIDGGAKAVTDLVKFRPELPAIMRKQVVAKVWNPEYGERFLEGLRKAGLEIAGEEGTADRSALRGTPASPAPSNKIGGGKQ